MEGLLVGIIVLLVILYIYYQDGAFEGSVKDTRTEAQKEYDNFMDKSGCYDDDKEDILKNRQWKEKVYGK